jgi:hypothetical protein
MDITNSAGESVWKMSYGYYQQCMGKCVEDELWILLTVQEEVCGR